MIALSSSLQDVRVHGGSSYMCSQKKFIETPVKRGVTSCKNYKIRVVTVKSISTTTVPVITSQSSLSQPIGKGGYGSIYLVYPNNETTKNTEICLPLVKKVTPFDNSKEVMHMKRMQGSKHVVKIVSYEMHPTTTEIYMEYCNKGSIEDELRDNLYLTEGRTQEIMRAVFQTLAQCHYQDIIHGDVKPGNFLKTHDNRIVAIDFGNASCERHFDHSKGTPHYMAPEQLRSETSHRSDIWSAGVMMYRLLSGKFPFEDRQNPLYPSISALWKEILMNEPRFNEYTWKNTSPECMDLIKKLLEKDVTKRLTALEALQHPWFSNLDLHTEKNKTSIISIEEKRNTRYNMMPSLQKSVMEYICKELYPLLTPIELSSSPNQTLRNQSIVLEHIRKYCENELPKHIIDPSELVQIQGILQKECTNSILEPIDILKLWSKPTLSLLAF